MSRTALYRLRAALLPVIALASIGAPSAANAQDYPSRSVDLIVPFAAGGGTDVLGRILSEGMSKRLGQRFIVVNRPGANTNIGTLSAVRSRPKHWPRGEPFLIQGTSVRTAERPRADLLDCERADGSGRKCVAACQFGCRLDRLSQKQA